MTHLKIYTGLQGEENLIEIDWFDHNGEHHTTTIQVNVLPQDKPRVLDILINGRLIRRYGS